MITKFKIYEDLQTPQVDDYVVAKINNINNIFGTAKMKLDKWVNNNIGQIKKITEKEVTVLYNDVSFYISHFFNGSRYLCFDLNEIEIFSRKITKVKMELELRKTEEKYNL